MNRMLFWSICSVMFHRIMTYKFDLGGIRMMLLFGIIEVYSILLRIAPIISDLILGMIMRDLGPEIGLSVLGSIRISMPRQNREAKL